jgi:hypothetical protein
MIARHRKTITANWRRLLPLFTYPAAAVAFCVVLISTFAGTPHTTARSATISNADCLRCSAAAVKADSVEAPPDIARMITLPTRHPERMIPAHYTVRSGDTLSGIAERLYGNPLDWGYLFYKNKKTITDDNLIYVGQTLITPRGMPKGYTLSAYLPKPIPVVVASVTAQPLARPEPAGGLLPCSGLEQLWDSAGGNPADAFIAAEIAMAESGGNQYATDHDADGSVDEGYWQINTSNGALATYDAYGNARSAITLSGDGSDWSPWVTYQTGVFSGLC